MMWLRRSLIVVALVPVLAGCGSTRHAAQQGGTDMLDIQSGQPRPQVPKNRLIVPAVSIGGVRFREPRKAVAQALGPGKPIGRYYRAYVHGRLRILYSYHDAYTGRAQALITKWSGYRTRSGIHVGSTRQALDGLHLKCFDRTCSSGKNPDYPGTIFTMRHGRVVEIFVGAS